MANLNKVKKYHFIYKTTNLLNDKYYVGMHSTSNLKDGYLGSGKRLRYSIRKYGVQNFKLEILEWFDTREALVNRETQLVNEDLLKDEMCLNLKPGGSGGWSSEEQRLNAAKSNQKQKWLKENDKEWNINRSKRLSASQLLAFEEGRRERKHFCDWTGKTHTEETKQKIGEASKIKQSGSSNSQFGTRWITNGTENKKIKKTDLMPDGWKFGRKINLDI
jgi:group I intron endonuclease